MEEERRGGVQEKEKEYVRGKIEKRKTDKNRRDRNGHMEGKKAERFGFLVEEDEERVVVTGRGKCCCIAHRRPTYSSGPNPPPPLSLKNIVQWGERGHLAS